MSKKYFLGRNQRAFGPLSLAEIETLKQSGQISSYNWIFQEGGSQWEPIDPAPPLPGTSALPIAKVEIDLPEAPQQAPVEKSRPPLRLVRASSVPAHTYRIVLFDHRNAVSGWLTGANDTGCEIHSDQNGSDPLFVANEAACLSLHDTRTGETLKVHVRISSISRTKGGWSYQASWSAGSTLPAILSHSNHEQRAGVAA